MIRGKSRDYVISSLKRRRNSRFPGPITESEGLSMKIMLKKDTDLKDLETKVNENLAALEADGAEIMGIEHGTEVLPVIRGKEIADYRTSYTVMIVYEPSTPEPLR